MALIVNPPADPTEPPELIFADVAEGDQSAPATDLRKVERVIGDLADLTTSIQRLEANRDATVAHYEAVIRQIEERYGITRLRALIAREIAGAEESLQELRAELDARLEEHHADLLELIERRGYGRRSVQTRWGRVCSREQPVRIIVDDPEAVAAAYPEATELTVKVSLLPRGVDIPGTHTERKPPKVWVETNLIPRRKEGDS